MKLTELAAPKSSKTTAKVFESYFGTDITFINSMSRPKATQMLTKVRSLLSEERRKPQIHSSEQNPAYLKLVVMEQALATRVRESVPTAFGASAGSTPAGGAGAQDNTVGQSGAQAKAKESQAIASIQDPKLKAVADKKAKGMKLTPDEETLLVNKAITTAESKRYRLYNMLKESEIQQAQVVLASQDMVDEVQKMIERVSTMQFKDLPALVEQIKGQVGIDQATQFNSDATSALAGLVQSLQGAKQQLEAGVGIVTGQQQTIPGQDDFGAEMPPPEDGVEELGAELDQIPTPDGEEEDLDVQADLGRERR